MQESTELQKAVLVGDAVLALSLAQRAIDQGYAPVDLINDAIGPARREAGELFEAGKYFVPELLMAARATKGVFEILRPLLAKQGVEPAGRIVLGTVQGDLHDIGKNLVGAMLEGGGFEVIDLGVNVTPNQFAAAVKERSADLVGLSALLTTTLPAMKATIELIQSSGLRDQVKIMVGDAPVTQSYANAISADGYAESAALAVNLARQLVAKQSTASRV